MEKILEISEVENFEGSDNYNRYDGYKIVTTEQTIFFGISNVQDCCENWGYLTSEDDLTEMIGAQLLDIYVTDTALGLVEDVEIYEGDIMFIDIVTDHGTFQLAAYNEHNGYYGHNAVLMSKQLNLDEYL